MWIYECESCGWKGHKDEVRWIFGHEFMNTPAPEDEEEYEEICVCPKCEPLQMTFEHKV